MSTEGARPTPYEQLGGEPAVRALVHRFYDLMREQEPALADIHSCEPSGRIDEQSRDRFGTFLVYWLGGPQTYLEKHGHPRLRMRHGHVRVDLAMRDAWLRSMKAAMDAQGVSGDARRYMDQRFTEVADFLRNVEG